MRIGVVGDFHLTNKPPERRKDDILQTAIRKFSQALDFFSSRECDCVIQVGDFFENAWVGNSVIVAAIDSLKNFDIPVYAVAGQHDITGHSMETFGSSPLNVLMSSGSVSLLTEDPTVIGNLHLYGSSFGQDVPQGKDPKACNVLVTHRMVGNRPLWPGQALEEPRMFLRSHPQFNIVLLGDYHYSFADKWSGRLILNTGALLRKNLTDVKLGHKPSVCVVDTETLDQETLELTVERVEQIFDLTEKVSRDSEALNLFAENLRNSRSSNSQILWKSLLKQVIVDKRVSKPAQELLDIALEDVCLR